MERREDTPARLTRRKYENKNKEERIKASKVFGTSIPRETCEEIERFLIENHITKVELIMVGYQTLKERFN